MSIKMVNKDVLRHVASKIYLASCNREVDENYYECCLKLTEHEINQYLTRLEILNYKTYISYWTEPDILANTVLPYCVFNCLEFVTVKMPAAQFLKWLLFIRNNISISIIHHASNPVYQEDEAAVKFLTKLIADVQLAIINELPEFKAARINDVPPLESAL